MAISPCFRFKPEAGRPFQHGNSPLVATLPNATDMLSEHPAGRFLPQKLGLERDPELAGGNSPSLMHSDAAFRRRYHIQIDPLVQFALYFNK
jgi:hypothetical protein